MRTSQHVTFALALVALCSTADAANSRAPRVTPSSAPASASTTAYVDSVVTTDDTDGPAPKLAPSKPVAIVPVATTPLQPTTWRAPAGSNLRAVLKAWAQSAGWQEPVWSPALDSDEYLIPSEIVLPGSYEDAVTALLAPYKHGDPPIQGDLYEQTRQTIISEKK